jgi:hypothetical protein
MAVFFSKVEEERMRRSEVHVVVGWILGSMASIVTICEVSIKYCARVIIYMSTPSVVVPLHLFMTLWWGYNQLPSCAI